MTRVCWSNIVLAGVFAGLLGLLLILRDVLLQAHIDGSILLFSSDGSVYFKIYQTIYAVRDILKYLPKYLNLALCNSPIVFMKLADGNLLVIQICNLALMFVSLNVAMGCFNSLRCRMLFLGLSLIFPYFSFGFLSLNKEVYAMCSAMFYGSYMIRGRGVYLFVALVLAACARYYMVAALLTLIVTVPRNGLLRTGRAVAILLTISLVAPHIIKSIPQYSSWKLLEGSGRAAHLMATAVDHYGYAIIYPIKYVLLLMQRPYSYMLGSHDIIGAIVSILSIAMILTVICLWLRSQILSLMVKRLIVAGFFAPIPIMWTEIMHWRYYSFVYFFFLFASLLRMEERWTFEKRASMTT